MSKAKLKKYIQTLSKEQVDDIVLQSYYKKVKCGKI